MNFVKPTRSLAKSESLCLRAKHVAVDGFIVDNSTGATYSAKHPDAIKMNLTANGGLQSVPSAIADLLQLIGRTNRTKFRDQVIAPMIEQGLLEMTLPEKPTSRLQKYRITDAGRAWLAR